jgi:multidrug efflux system outer membrane protein
MIPNPPEFGLNLPENYPEKINNISHNLNSEDELSWRSYFRDPQLVQLIELGLENNQDLKISILNIQEAKELYGIQRSDILPEIDASGSFTRQKVGGAAFGQNTGQGGNIFEFYDVNAGISAYEIDLFGRIRSLNQAAFNDFISTQYVKDTVRLALITDIAATYASYIANHGLLKLAEQRIRTRKESLDLISLRTEKGISTELEKAQAETLYLAAKSDQYQFINDLERDKNALQLLVGKQIEIQSENLQSIPRLESYIPTVPIGMPSDLLQNRPDIKAAEYQLYKENANIGAARAAFFPSVSLTATAGSQSMTLGNLFESSTQTWLFSPQINVPIFAGGRLKNNLDLAEVRTNIAVQEYEKITQVAFRDVLDAIVSVNAFSEKVKVQKDLIEATNKRLNLTEKRYNAGIDNFLSVLDSKREAYAAEQNFIREKLQETLAKISLFKALGNN